MFLILFIIAFNIAIYLLNNRMSKFLNLYDKPDNLRKLHKSKVPLTGGIIILLNAILALILSLMEQFYYKKSILFESEQDLFILLISILIIFLIGFFDDKYNISANKRFVFFFIILFPIIFLSENLIIKQVEVSFLEYVYTLPLIFSIFWTVLCFLLFINAFNMFDGINYQAGCYSIYLSLFFLINNFFDLFFLFILTGLITFVILNHKYKSFLGDGGAYLLAFIFGYFFIRFYNQTDNIKADHILLFMIIPGIDLIRLFILRISRGTKPFSPDRNHFHHIMLKRYNLFETNLIIQSLIIIPSLLGYYLGYTYIFFITQMIFYFYLVLHKKI